MIFFKLFIVVLLHHVGIMDVVNGDSLAVRTRVANTAPLPKVVTQVVTISDANGLVLNRMTGPKHTMFSGDTLNLEVADRVGGLHIWEGGTSDLYKVTSEIYEQNRLLDAQVCYMGILSDGKTVVSSEHSLRTPYYTDLAIPLSMTEESDVDDMHIVRIVLYHPEVIRNIVLSQEHTHGTGYRYEVWGTSTQVMMGRIYSQKTLLTQGYTSPADGLFNISLIGADGTANSTKAKVYEIRLFKNSQGQVPVVSEVYPYL